MGHSGRHLESTSRAFFDRNSFCVLLDFMLSLSPPLLTFAIALRNLLWFAIAFLAGRVEMRDPRAVIPKLRAFEYIQLSESQVTSFTLNQLMRQLDQIPLFHIPIQFEYQIICHSPFKLQ